MKIRGGIRIGDDFDVNEPIDYLRIDQTYDERTTRYGQPDNSGRGNITVLDKCSKHVRKLFDCSGTQITSLEGGPEICDGSYICNETNIKNLIGAPKSVGKNFSCTHNKQLTSLEGIPSKIGGYFSCISSPIETIDHLPEYVGGFVNLGNTQIESLQDIHKKIKQMNGALTIPKTIKSHILGVLLVKGVMSIYLAGNAKKQVKEAVKIVDEYLKQPMSKQRMLECQTALIDAGLDEYAQL